MLHSSADFNDLKDYSHEMSRDSGDLNPDDLEEESKGEQAQGTEEG